VVQDAPLANLVEAGDQRDGGQGVEHALTSGSQRRCVPATSVGAWK